MSGDVTYQALDRLSYLPDRDSLKNGYAIAGQNYYDIYFTGGTISNVNLVDCIIASINLDGATITNATIDSSSIGGSSPSTGVFTALVSTGIATLQSGLVKATRVVTASGAVTVSTSDYFVGINKTVGAATTVNLPAGSAGQEFVITDIKGDAATNNITITPNSGTINGSATFVINTNYGSATIIYNGSTWSVI